MIPGASANDMFAHAQRILNQQERIADLDAQQNNLQGRVDIVDRNYDGLARQAAERDQRIAELEQRVHNEREGRRALLEIRAGDFLQRLRDQGKLVADLRLSMKCLIPTFFGAIGVGIGLSFALSELDVLRNQYLGTQAQLELFDELSQDLAEFQKLQLTLAKEREIMHRPDFTYF